MFAGKTLISKSPEIFWTDERLRQMAGNELLAHGGNKRDLELLRQQFKNTEEDNKPDQSEIPEA